MSELEPDRSTPLKALLDAGDADGIYDLHSRLDALEAAHQYDTLQRALYWDERNIAAVLTISHAGIRHGLTTAAKAVDAAVAAQLLAHAKTLAYNLASFTWPGWDERGIALSKTDVATGLDAAWLNLQLAHELKRPPKAHANALWLLGAHRLAAGDYAAAADAFVLGQSHADDADEPLVGRMLEGYTRLANALATPGDADLRELFDAAVSRLENEGSPGATEYANQLKTAAKVFGV